MSNSYSIAELHSFSQKFKTKNGKLYEKVRQVAYARLRDNPFFGPNIKKLKGEFEAYYRYRIGNYRLFYKVDEEKRIVFVFDLRPRKDAYK